MGHIKNAHIIAIDQLSDERRQVIHELVKAKADGWWHNMPNTWIVGGHESTFWRDELYPVLAGTGASILVMHLPEALGDRAWAFQGPNSINKANWLHETYLGSPRSA